MPIPDDSTHNDLFSIAPKLSAAEVSALAEPIETGSSLTLIRALAMKHQMLIGAMILDPYGRIIKETWAAENAMVSAELDLSLLAMSTGRRWIHGRRPDLYHILTQPQGYERDAISARFSDEIP